MVPFGHSTGPSTLQPTAAPFYPAAAASSPPSWATEFASMNLGPSERSASMSPSLNGSPAFAQHSLNNNVTYTPGVMNNNATYAPSVMNNYQSHAPNQTRFLQPINIGGQAGQSQDQQHGHVEDAQLSAAFDAQFAAHDSALAQANQASDPKGKNRATSGYIQPNREVTDRMRLDAARAEHVDKLSEDNVVFGKFKLDVVGCLSLI